jgi:hypothetical protein
MSELAAWDSFYVIVGSAAGALIGLQFVVVTLIAQRQTRAAPEASAAFGTPTIVHFSAALLLSALVRVPWQAIMIPAVLWAVVGSCGTLYSLNVSGACASKACTNRSWRTGYFMSCCRWPPT